MVNLGYNRSVEEDNLQIEAIIKAYLGPVYGFVRRLSGDAFEAEDIAQDVFLKVWKNLDRYDSKQDFKAWLFAIARNTTIDWLRKHRPMLFSSLDQPEGDGDFVDNLIDEEPLPAELFERAELAQVLSEALAQLSLDQRTVILLHVEQDLTFEAISQIAGRPLNTVKSQYRRGLITLRQILAPK
ncbi:MAG: hypothetical protein A2556_02115 [Candidatus Vogelbacteria bacterium RIFOXYD2_FULL_44_9]|uniref:RNA polymerase sigma factor n=1 Tax=Candidatus Vogelbacteria bacterium RIFOXYD2_FULL_44_9 TaxID=1802441 RepID=A0A1G2QJZ9_9BACT|nr:MAG: hypothetical protein A2556_02115 [Candidatus Vogelbacteria bacterium RIFOXYD2_FULL_44_9]